jgi:hypothetical protein
MRIYYCKEPYLSGLAGEPMPHWPRDYNLVAEMHQAGLTGREALERAFDKAQSHNAAWTARSMRPGDVVGLDDGHLYRCEMDGWSDIGQMWVARVQNSRERVR